MQQEATNLPVLSYIDGIVNRESATAHNSLNNIRDSIVMAQELVCKTPEDRVALEMYEYIREVREIEERINHLQQQVHSKVTELMYGRAGAE